LEEAYCDAFTGIIMEASFGVGGNHEMAGQSTLA